MAIDLEKVSLEDVKLYLESMGKQGTKTLSVLGKVNPEIVATYNTEIGKILLQTDINRLEELLCKIYRREASDLEFAEFDYLNNVRLPDVLDKLRIYLKGTAQIKEVAAKRRKTKV